MKKFMKLVNRKRLAQFCLLLAVLLPALAITGLAAENAYAKAAGEWVLDGVFWVAIVLGLVGVAMSAIKRNLTAAIITLIATALVCTICKNTSIITSLGTALKDAFGL